MLEYDVVAKRIDAHGSSARCKNAEIVLDTDVDCRVDAFNPAELLLTGIAACMIKGIERIAPVNHFKYRSVEIPSSRCPTGQPAIHVVHNLRADCRHGRR